MYPEREALLNKKNLKICNYHNVLSEHKKKMLIVTSIEVMLRFYTEKLIKEKESSIKNVKDSKPIEFPKHKKITTKFGPKSPHLNRTLVNKP